VFITCLSLRVYPQKFEKGWQAAIEATHRNDWPNGAASDHDPLDFALVCRNHQELVWQIGDRLVFREELYKWEIWLTGESWRLSYEMRARQVEINLLDWYPGLKIFHQMCDCNLKPEGVIIIIIKMGCRCWSELNNIYLYDVIDANGGHKHPRIDRYYPKMGVVITQTRQQRELYQSWGYETFVIEHHTTLTMKRWEGYFPFNDTIRYPKGGELFHVGMYYSGGETSAKNIIFDNKTTEFEIFKFEKFHGDKFLWFHASLVWMKNRADILHNVVTSLYKGSTRATTAACLGIPVILHNGSSGHLEFSTIRTDHKPYFYLTDTGEDVRKFVDRWVADRNKWEKAKHHVYEISRCYHSKLIVDMYVRVFSYLLERKFDID